jgi:CRP-like cAMP-binding protein
LDTPCALIDALSPTNRATVLARAVPRRLRRGQSLYLAGDRARRVHLLAAGVMKLTARTAEGSSTILCLALPGEVVGELAAIDGLPQPLDAVAADTCELLGLDADLWLEVLGRDPVAALEVARCMARRTRWICDTATERSSSAVPARLAGRLLDLADIIGRIEDRVIELELPLAQEDLGRLAGMCRESACKTLRTFKRRGWLDYDRGRLRILRPDALERIRCAGRLAPAQSSVEVTTR